MEESSAKKRYLEYVDADTGYANYNDFKSFLYGKDDSLTKHLTEKYILPFVQSLDTKNITVCDIGGGDGKRISKILQKIFERFNVTSTLTFIEPSHAGCKLFDSNKDTLSDFTEVSIINSRFEDFYPDNKKKFDLILLIHSIFTFSDNETIKRLIELKSEKGKIFIVANKEKSFIAALNRKLHTEYSEKRFEIADLENLLKASNIPYNQSEFVTEFSVHKENFDDFYSTLIMWLSMGKLDASAEIVDAIKNLASSEDEKMYYFKETEVVLKL